MSGGQDELERLLSRSVQDLDRGILELAAAQVRGGVADAEERLSEQVARILIFADLLGRRRVALEAQALDVEAAEFAADGDLASVPFARAIEDLLRRTPELAKTAGEVSRLYRVRHVFAVVRSVVEEVTRRVAKTMTDLLRAGVPSIRASAVVAEMEDWSRSYTATVYETNAATAYTAGRMAAQQEPGVARILPAWEVVGSNDSDTRRGRDEDRGENHLAALGLVAGVNDPIWTRATPPFGYRCRHGLRSVALPELRRRGLIAADGSVLRYEPPGFAQFSPHPNFGSSPLQRIYGLG